MKNYFKIIILAFLARFKKLCNYVINMNNLKYFLYFKTYMNFRNNKGRK